MCLLLYGCDRQYLLSQNLVLEAEIKALPSRCVSRAYILYYAHVYRRKTGARASAVSDPVIVDARVMSILSSLLKQGLDELSKSVVQFFHSFVFEASLVEGYEADNFILRNSLTLTTW